MGDAIMNTPPMNKTYLGDGVYAEWHADRQMILLTTENGVSVESSIWIEAEVYEALVAFVGKLRAALVQ